MELNDVLAKCHLLPPLVVVAAAKAMFFINSMCILQLLLLSFARILIFMGREAEQ